MIGLGSLAFIASLAVALPGGTGPTSNPNVSKPAISAAPHRIVAVIPDEDVIVGAPDETIVARRTLRFVRRVQSADAAEFRSK